MPREGADAHLIGDALDMVAEVHDVDVGEDRDVRSLARCKMLIDLSSKTADATQKRSLLKTNAAATDDGSVCRILASAKMH